MHEFKAMNTTLHTWGLPAAKQQEVESWFQFVEGKLSRFKDGSELSQMNRAYGKPFFMSALLSEVMAEAIRYNQETDGIFNPFLGRVLADLGYRESFEKLGAAAVSVETHGLDSLKPVYTFDRAMKCMTVAKDYEVDLGGIAKAWSASYLCRKLQKDGVAAGAIDAGGDIVAWGEHPAGVWEMAIANPLAPAEDLVVVKRKQGFGIATSSKIKRHWVGANGEQLHHLIDSRTNMPAASDLMQVSVLAPDLTTAEIYTKCVLILGAEQGIPWLEAKRPELAVIAVRNDSSLVYGGKLDNYELVGVTTNG